MQQTSPPSLHYSVKIITCHAVSKYNNWKYRTYKFYSRAHQLNTQNLKATHELPHWIHPWVQTSHRLLWQNTPGASQIVMFCCSPDCPLSPPLPLQSTTALFQLTKMTPNLHLTADGQCRENGIFLQWLSILKLLLSEPGNPQTVRGLISDLPVD